MQNKIITYGILSAAFAALVLLTFQCGQSEQGGQSGQASVMDKVERGKYLVTVAGCSDCHTPKVYTEKGLELDSSLFLSGHPANEELPDIPSSVMEPGKWGGLGNMNFTAWVGPWGVSYAANLTPDQVTGIGAWNEESFIMAMRNGKHLGAGRPILPPMPWFNLAATTDEDLSAMFAYFKSIKPIENMVPPPVPPEELMAVK